MKYIKITFATTFMLLLSMHSHAAAPTGCAAKKQEVENQLTYALEHNNTHQISGLQKALREIEEHCTDPELLRQRQLKITEKYNKLTERQAELDKAKETGDPKKMAQKQKKLDRAREELQDAQNMLYR
ncbi:DUF1090 domain-containing protein [Salmonella enterica]|nr:DUF1090 domain-containing protein [Salmonella enterica]